MAPAVETTGASSLNANDITFALCLYQAPRNGNGL
jgi:hypothetical protein